jgi:hypothetical protein
MPDGRIMPERPRIRRRRTSPRRDWLLAIAAWTTGLIVMAIMFVLLGRMLGSL